ncbi:capsular biosynthesis protein [Psychrobacter immobilis]|uniref:capsular biosynthesis protein n=1 Tax=Psychrobacter immobilis TaxID=498 RepID=UPI003FD41085
MSAFIFPMAGLSSRFYNAGYEKPKFQLPIKDETMFEWSVKSFKNYFKTDKFLFIARDNDDFKQFLLTKIQSLGIVNYRVLFLSFDTRGQAETVYEGISRNTDFFEGEDIFIFNIDSKRHDFIKPNWLSYVDGYIELFVGDGNHWSFARLDNNQKVLQTAEKNRISNYCSDGLYYFKSTDIFNLAYQDLIDNSKFEKGECYIAPMYNYLVEHDYIIKGDVIAESTISFCGTPEEYESFIRNK